MDEVETKQNKKRVAQKKDVWHWIKRGVIMQLHFDFETSGIDRFGMSHSIQGWPFVTEYGDALGDISGNHVNSMQVLPKRPEHLIGDPAAPIVQRLEDGMAEYDREDRTPYPYAMADIAHRFENAPFLYGLANEERLNVKFTDINKQAKSNKECEEEVVPVPLKLEDGSVVHHVRYHPERNKVSYLFEDDDANSPYYENIDNLYYIDEEGKKWRWVEPSLKISGFNVKGYDIPVLRTNMLRAGMHPSNVPFAYSRATISNKQRAKNYLCDERHTALQVALHGQHGEDGLKMGELLNPMTGKFYRSEALGAYFKANQGFPNQIRMVDGGIFLSNGELFDLQDAHGGVIDSVASLAFNNKMNDISPEIVTTIEEQSDEKACIRQLQGIDPTGKSVPLVSMPLRDFPSDQTDSLYLFMNTDEQFGSFKQFVFFHMTGDLRNYKFNGKYPHQFDIEDWEELLEKKWRDPESPIRIEAFRRFGGFLPYNFVLQHSKEADRFRGKLECVERDCAYLREYPEMTEKLYTAIGRQNAKRRFSPGVQNPLMEDEWLRQGFGEVYYQEEAIRQERREMFLKQKGKPGPRKVAGVVETVKNQMQDHYNYLNMADEALMRLFVTAHRIDSVDPNSPDAEAVLENYLDLCKRAYKKLRDKNVPQIRLMGNYFMKGGTPRFKSIEAARRFRDAMRVKAMEDYLSEMEETEDFAKGMISTEFSKSGNKLLFANADRGEKGATPHIVDSVGREISVDYIRKQKPADVINLLKNKEWKARFYRLRSEPIMDILVKICVETGKRHLIPDALYKGFYEPRRQLSLHGAPNEDPTTARHSDLNTFEHQLKRLEINAKIRDQRLLERPNDPLLGEANKLIKYEEGQRILAKSKKYHEDLKRRFPYKKTLVSHMQFDPKSGLPYDYIHHAIEKENHVVIDVPAWHLRYPITQYDLRAATSLSGFTRDRREHAQQNQQRCKSHFKRKRNRTAFPSGPCFFPRGS